MKTVYTDEHRLQDGKAELNDGKLVPCYEMPRRADMVLARVEAQTLGPVLAPERFGPAPLACVHTRPFLRFLETAWDAWVAEHGDYDALPLTWATRGFHPREPETIDGKLSFFPSTPEHRSRPAPGRRFAPPPTWR